MAKRKIRPSVGNWVYLRLKKLWWPVVVARVENSGAVMFCYFFEGLSAKPTVEDVLKYTVADAVHQSKITSEGITDGKWKIIHTDADDDDFRSRWPLPPFLYYPKVRRVTIYSDTDLCDPVKIETASEDINVEDLPRDHLETSISCLLYTSPSPRDATLSRMPSSA